MEDIEDICLIASLVEINTLRNETVASRVIRLVDSSERNNNVAVRVYIQLLKIPKDI